MSSLFIFVSFCRLMTEQNMYLSLNNKLFSSNFWLDITDMNIPPNTYQFSSHGVFLSVIKAVPHQKSIVISIKSEDAWIGIFKICNYKNLNFHKVHVQNHSLFVSFSFYSSELHRWVRFIIIVMDPTRFIEILVHFVSMLKPSIQFVTCDIKYISFYMSKIIVTSGVNGAMIISKSSSSISLVFNIFS